MKKDFNTIMLDETAKIITDPALVNLLIVVKDLHLELVAIKGALMSLEHRVSKLEDPHRIYLD